MWNNRAGIQRCAALSQGWYKWWIIVSLQLIGMSALVCLSGEGERSDRAAPLSALASGSLAASTVWSTKERKAAREGKQRKARERPKGESKKGKGEREKQQRRREAETEEQQGSEGSKSWSWTDIQQRKAESERMRIRYGKEGRETNYCNQRFDKVIENRSMWRST